jgi:choline dehydrogenase-like flavoprotein
MEQLPNPDNRVAPDFTHLDAIGLPRPRISFTIGRYVRDGMVEATALHERLFEQLNATQRTHVGFPFGAGHLMGTTQMGTDPTRSVTDSFGRSHDVPNLFVAGSSLFPTVGTANPTLTLAALALRTADAISRL